MDLRSYARAKEVYEAGKKEADPLKRPKGSLIDKVSAMTFEIVQEELDKRSADGMESGIHRTEDQSG